MAADHTIKTITKTDPEVSAILTDMGRENAALREQLSGKARRVAELEAENQRIYRLAKGLRADKDARIAELEKPPALLLWLTACRNAGRAKSLKYHLGPCDFVPLHSGKFLGLLL